MHTARSESDANARGARISSNVEEFVGHTAHVAAARAAGSSPGKEGLARHMAQLCKKQQQCGRGGCNDGAVRGGLGSRDDAKSHGDAASGGTREYLRSSGKHDATATAKSALSGGDK